jgi:hypothetical protein
MKSTRLRLTLACLAILGAAIAVAGGTAGNRTADVTFAAFPGPASVTYAENIAYSVSIENTGASTFTQVAFRQRVPAATVGTTTYAATLVASSCGAVVQDGFAVCEFPNLGSHQVQRATLVWQAPAIPSSTGCTDCLVTDGLWLIKEGKPTNSNEVFATEVVEASLLAGQGSNETTRAGGYETESAVCSAAGGNLRTNQALSAGNPVSTTICLPAFVIPSGSIDLGYASTIVESLSQQFASAHPELGESNVCVAELGENCVPGHTSVNWGDKRARHIFRILDSALTTNPKKITDVYHNGVLLPPCAGSNADPGFAHGCVVDIARPTGKEKVWVVLVDAPINGPFSW